MAKENEVNGWTKLYMYRCDEKIIEKFYYEFIEQGLSEEEARNATTKKYWKMEGEL